MFPNPFRKLRKLWAGTGAYATPPASDTPQAQEAPAANDGPRSRQDTSAATHQAYKDAHNLPISPARYATPAPVDSVATANLFGNSRASTTFPSKHSLFTVQAARPALSDAHAPPHCIHNIPAPQVPLFGAAFAAPHVSNGETPHPDATPRCPPTPPSTPPEEEDIPRPLIETPENTAQGATVEDDNTDGGRRQTSTPTPDERTARPHLQPKRQQDRRRNPATPQPEEDWAAEIIQEADTPEDPLPAGYTGTFRGIRHYDPHYSDMLDCGYDNVHHLICGHYIESTEPCGSNCKTEQLEEMSFDRPTCRNIVHDVLHNKLTPAEVTKCTKLKAKDDTLAFIGCCVEYVTRHAPQLTGGVMEAVVAFSRKDYGRACKHSEAPSRIEVQSLEDQVRARQASHEKWQREKYAREHPLNDPVKRKAFEEALNLPVAPKRFGSPGEDDGEKREQEHRNKKQKTRLESHQERITEDTRGMKRPFLKDDDTTMPDASRFANKKPKTKHTPFALVPGFKRKSSPTFDEPFTPTIPKKACILQPPKFGVANFAALPAHIVGPILRKRTMSEDESKVEIETAIDSEEKRRKMKARCGDEEQEQEKSSAFKTREGGFEAFRRASREWDVEEEL